MASKTYICRNVHPFMVTQGPMNTLSGRERFIYNENGFHAIVPNPNFQTEPYLIYKRSPVGVLRAHVLSEPRFTRAGNLSAHQSDTMEDQPYTFFLAQLIHYGLEFEWSKDAAKMSLAKSLQAQTLQVPDEISQLKRELKRRWRHKWGDTFAARHGPTDELSDVYDSDGSERAFYYDSPPTGFEEGDGWVDPDADSDEVSDMESNTGDIESESEPESESELESGSEDDDRSEISPGFEGIASSESQKTSTPHGRVISKTDNDVDGQSGSGEDETDEETDEGAEPMPTIIDLVDSVTDDSDDDSALPHLPEQETNPKPSESKPALVSAGTAKQKRNPHLVDGESIRVLGSKRKYMPAQTSTTVDFVSITTPQHDVTEKTKRRSSARTKQLDDSPRANSRKKSGSASRLAEGVQSSQRSNVPKTARELNGLLHVRSHKTNLDDSLDVDGYDWADWKLPLRKQRRAA